MILGIDPARDGAAVLYDPEMDIVDCVWSWKYRNRKKPIYETKFTKFVKDKILFRASWDLRDGGIIANKIAQECNDIYLGIEDAYVSRQNPRSGLRVARFGGELVGGLSANMRHDLKEVFWVTASDWRYQLLKVNPFTKREQCKKISLTYIPELNETIKPHLEIHGYLDHVTDALGVALWTNNKLSSLENSLK